MHMQYIPIDVLQVFIEQLRDERGLAQRCEADAKHAAVHASDEREIRYFAGRHAGLNWAIVMLTELVETQAGIGREDS
jgi:hypothetical protein